MEFKMRCGFCGESNDLDMWCEGQPKEQYCCPNCSRTIRRDIGKCTVTESGFVLPGKIMITEVIHSVG